MTSSTFLKVPKCTGGAEAFGASSTGSTPRSSITSDGGFVQIKLSDKYEILSELGQGTYSSCVQALCLKTRTKVALKLLRKRDVTFRDFLREFRYARLFAAHPSIIDTYDVAFETAEYYAFAQQCAVLGDLFDFIVPRKGLAESSVKCVAKQVIDAVQFLHHQRVVHRDIKPENVLVMERNLRQVRLCDFGMCRPQATIIHKTCTSIPYTAPEIAEAVRHEHIRIEPSADVWALAVLLFCCLTGTFPWVQASSNDRHWEEFVAWQKRKVHRAPTQFRQFTPRFQRCLRRILEPRPDKRSSLQEITKYFNDNWKVSNGRNNCTDLDTKSDMSFGFDAKSTDSNNKEHLEKMLAQCGVHTGIDRCKRKHRVSEWLRLSSPSFTGCSSDSEYIENIDNEPSHDV